MKTLTPIAETARQIAAGKLRSAALVESCLEAIADPQGEGRRAFLHVAAESARATAKLADARTLRGPLAGVPISLKDLLDVAGEQTLAGSVVLKNSPAKTRDAVVVARLRIAGAVLMGRTNMTEFAYSALGINPHYGTPLNPWDRATGRIPGGSSAGAAVSVADGMAHAAIGSDTGGSVRIPSALCGLAGFKPTSRRVPLEGAFPLSSSLDSLGPLAPTVACCALLDAVLAGEEPQTVNTTPLRGLRLAVLQGFVLEKLDTPVAAAYAAALTLLSAQGAMLVDARCAALDRIAECNQKGGFVAAESYAVHRRLLETSAAAYDPRVRVRIERGAQQSAADYIDLLQARRDIIAEAAHSFQDFDAVLLPTLPCVAPPLAPLLASDDAYMQTNAFLLRNPSLFNFLDGCALSLPCHLPGDAPVGLMIAGMAGQDKNILRIGAAVEAALAAAGRAVYVSAAQGRS